MFHVIMTTQTGDLFRYGTERALDRAAAHSLADRLFRETFDVFSVVVEPAPA